MMCFNVSMTYIGNMICTVIGIDTYERKDTRINKHESYEYSKHAACASQQVKRITRMRRVLRINSTKCSYLWCVFSLFVLLQAVI